MYELLYFGKKLNKIHAFISNLTELYRCNAKALHVLTSTHGQVKLENKNNPLVVFNNLIFNVRLPMYNFFPLTSSPIRMLLKRKFLQDYV